MSIWQFAIFCFMWFWTIGGAAVWGLTLGRQWGDGSLRKLFDKIGERKFADSVTRGALLSLFGWPYLFYRDLLKPILDQQDRGEG